MLRSANARRMAALEDGSPEEAVYNHTGDADEEMDEQSEGDDGSAAGTLASSPFPPTPALSLPLLSSV
jgi:hypothetical protein